MIRGADPIAVATVVAFIGTAAVQHRPRFSANYNTNYMILRPLFWGETYGT